MNRDHFGVVCKHKHMLENGAPPGKFEVMYHLLPIKFHGFHNKINF